MATVPDLRVKDRRTPELRLPEITREDLARLVSHIDLTKVDLPSAGIANAVEGAAAAVFPGKRARSRRWPLLVGGPIVAGQPADPGK